MAIQEIVKIEGSPRELNKRANRELREEKRVPAVLYGPEVTENLHFSVDELELEKILRKQQTKLQFLTVNGKEFKTLLKRVEYDPVSDRPIHADFYVLADKHKVTLRIPVKIVGKSRGVIEAGGRLFQPMKVVRIRVFPEFIPTEFVVDISELNVGTSFHVSDLDLNGITPLDAMSRTIITVRPPKGIAFLESLEADTGEAAETTEEDEAATEEGAEDSTEEKTEN